MAAANPFPKAFDKDRFKSIRLRNAPVFWAFMALTLAGYVATAYFVPVWMGRYAAHRFPNVQVYFDVGTAIGGVLGPAVAVVAACLTFFVFREQYRANEVLARTAERDEVLTRIERFENRFFQLIGLHNENVAQIRVRGAVGRAAFEELFRELRFVCKLVQRHYRNHAADLGEISIEEQTQVGYQLFFFGVSKESSRLSRHLLASHVEHLAEDVAPILLRAQRRLHKPNDQMHQRWFGGRQAVLGHYFRNLYQIVQYVAEQPTELLTEEQRYAYAKLVRAQLRQPRADAAVV